MTSYVQFIHQRMEHKGQLLFPAGFAVGAAGHQAGWSGGCHGP